MVCSVKKTSLRAQILEGQSELRSGAAGLVPGTQYVRIYTRYTSVLEYLVPGMCHSCGRYTYAINTSANGCFSPVKYKYLVCITGSTIPGTLLILNPTPLV